MDKKIFPIMTNGIIDLSLVCYKQRRQEAKEYKCYDYNNNPFFKIHSSILLRILSLRAEWPEFIAHSTLLSAILSLPNVSNGSLPQLAQDFS